MTRTRKVLLNVSAMIGALLAVSGWAVRKGASAIDDRYVHADAFTVYQQSQAQQHQLDSLTMIGRFEHDSAFMQRILDATCADRPTVRACRP